MKEKRIDAILQILEKNNFVTGNELSKELNVAESTVRRDLQNMENMGLLTRIHGGAVKKKNGIISEISYLQRKEINLQLKIQIAKKAVSLISDNDVFFLGPGTTSEIIMKYLKTKNNIIITNSFNIFSKYSTGGGDKKLVITPGIMRPETGAVVGTFTNDFLGKLHVDIAFSGANCLNKGQVMSSSEDEGTAQATILNNAKKKYILTDHSKFDIKSFFTFFSLKNLDAIITDNEINDIVRKKYEKYCNII